MQPRETLNLKLIKVGNPEKLSTQSDIRPTSCKYFIIVRVLTDTELHNISVIRPADNQVNKKDRYPVQSPFAAPQCMRGRHL